MPLSLLFLLVEAVGGSFTATFSDLARYNADKHKLEVNRSADPFMFQIVLRETE